MKKIMGFDNWTGGSHHFERLVKPFAEQGLDLRLLHLGSWGNDIGRPKEETLGILQVRDICYYGNIDFPDLLRREKPDLVLFMSIDTFSHRAFNRYCREANVPTIHLLHGLMRVQAVNRAARWKVRIVPQLLFALGRVPKAMRHVWPCYAKSLWRTKASLSEWKRFLSDIVLGAMGRFTTKRAEDARTDHCCVLVQMDVESAVEKYSLRREDVSVVGLPDLISFGIAPEMIGWNLDHENADAPYVMYIDTGFIFSGGVYASPKDFIGHLVRTGKALEARGKRLIFKPHPDFFRTNLLDDVRNAGIEICEKKDFLPRLQQCCAAIVASLVPAILGLPLLLAKDDALSTLDYGDLLTSYPRAKELTDLADFSELLAEERVSLDVEKTRTWIFDNAGPLPAEEMPLRVARVAIDLIAAFRKKSATAHAG